MKIPKIIFTYSRIYDQNCEKWSKLSRKNKGAYPSPKKVLNYIKKIKPLWKKHEKAILTELSKVSHLNWKKEEIPCYVVGRISPFSDPLTLPVYGNRPDYFIDVLVHELIHQLFTQKGNQEKSKKAWEYFFRKLKNEDHKTIIHIPLHAIHSHIYLKFFDKKRLKRDFDLIKFIPAYKRSWEIVHKIGYQEIIKEFTKRIK